MTFRGPGPWVASVGLHLAAGAAFLLLVPPAPVHEVVRMRFVTSQGQAAAAVVSRSSWMPPAAGHQGSSEPSIPGWQGVAVPPAGDLASGAMPVSLDEILGPATPTPADPAPGPIPETVGWTGPGGLGYTAPPLPPPALTPPQGARWNLVLSVPAGGGPARSFEGLDSGHPDLDRWLEEYLRTVSFPSGPDGAEYQLRWNLRLESGKPR